MELFRLPVETKIEKNIPKEIIYRNSGADEKLKRIFIDNVEKIKIMNSLNYSNSNMENYINKSERYEEINFIKLIIKKKGKENIISKLFHQIIPKSIVIVFEFGDEILISAANKKIDKEKVILEEVYDTKWINIESLILKELRYENLNSTNLKSFYTSIVEKIRTINLSRDLKFKNIIKKENIEILEKLNREIDELKLSRKKETQVNKIVEIQEKLMKKITERNRILKEEE